VNDQMLVKESKPLTNSTDYFPVGLYSVLKYQYNLKVRKIRRLAQLYWPVVEHEINKSD